MGDPGFVSGSIGVLIDRAVQVIEGHIKIALCCRKELGILENLVKEIQPINMEIQQYGIAIRQSQGDLVNKIEPVTVNNWLQALNRIIEDAIKIVHKCQVPAYNMVSRYLLSKKIRKSIDSLQSHLERLPLIGFTQQLRFELQNIQLQSHEAAQRQSSIPPTRQPSLASYRQQPIQEACIVGQDEVFETLKRLLTDDNEIAASATSRIGVVGMGGSGKTLLLKRALNDKQVQQHFEKDLILWLTVSQNLSSINLINLRNNLGRQIDLHISEGFDVRWSEEDAKRWIYQKTSSRRFLLFLDDIWEDSEILLEKLGVPDDQMNDSSKIVVSTRDRRVLSKMRVGTPIVMDSLSADQSWSLFCFHAFVGNQHTPHVGIEKIARDVCAECDRLPLALKVIGAAMAGITAPSDWRLTLEKLQNADKVDPHVEKKLYNRLRLSYDALCTSQYLPLQLCFLYLGTFKEDEEMYVQDVINLWIGEGLLPTEDGKDPLEVGRAYANFLVDRCLIEASIKDADGQVVIFSVHDVLHHLALQIAEQQENCCFRAGKGLVEFPLKHCTGKTRISLRANNLRSIPNGYRGQGLRSMLLSENISLEYVPSGVVTTLTSLRLLDLGGTSIKNLPHNIGALKHLVFLRLAKSPIVKLPDSVTCLKKLEILDLSECYQLSELPYELGKMTSLIYLDLSFCQQLKCMPCGISALTSLQYLKMERCWKTWPQATPPQRKLLRDPMGDRAPARFQDLHPLKHLKWLALECSNEPITDGIVGDMTEMRTLILRMSHMKELPEDMRGMVKLSSLFVESNVLGKIPSWICDFQLLNCLILRDCPQLEEIPAGLEKLEWLRRLDIVKSSSLKELPDAFGEAGAFPRLESFWLEETDGVESFPPIRDGALPLLKKLGLVFCSNVRTIPPGLENLQNLRELHVYGSPLILESIEEEGGEAWSAVRAMEGKKHVEILRKSIDEHRHKDGMGCSSICKRVFPSKPWSWCCPSWYYP